MAFKVGDSVPIYDNPVTRTTIEGIATIITVYGNVARWGDNILFEALVRFEPNGPTVIRDIVQIAGLDCGVR